MEKCFFIEKWYLYQQSFGQILIIQRQIKKMKSGKDFGNKIIKYSIKICSNRVNYNDFTTFSHCISHLGRGAINRAERNCKYFQRCRSYHLPINISFIYDWLQKIKK